MVAVACFGLGDTVEQSRGYLLDYRAREPDVAEMIAGSALPSPEAVADTVSAFGDAGTDELIRDPTVGDRAQVDQLAPAI